jgi:hypothetical protein
MLEPLSADAYAEGGPSHVTSKEHERAAQAARKADIDLVLVRLCEGGALGGVAIAAAQLQALCWLQLLQLPALVCLWWAYKVVKVFTADFTNLQWDMLLLEAGVALLPVRTPPLIHTHTSTHARTHTVSLDVCLSCLSACLHAYLPASPCHRPVWVSFATNQKLYASV